MAWRIIFTSAGLTGDADSHGHATLPYRAATPANSLGLKMIDGGPRDFWRAERNEYLIEHYAKKKSCGKP